jgi:hypothetical protein
MASWSLNLLEMSAMAVDIRHRDKNGEKPETRQPHTSQNRLRAPAVPMTLSLS